MVSLKGSAIRHWWCDPAIFLVCLHQHFEREQSWWAIKLFAHACLANDSALAFNNAGCNLHEYCFDGVCAGPATRRQQFHTYSATLHHKPFDDVWLHDMNKWRRQWEIVWENNAQQNVWYILFAHIFAEFGIGIKCVEPGMPFEQIVVH